MGPRKLGLGTSDGTSSFLFFACVFYVGRWEGGAWIIEGAWSFKGMGIMRALPRAHEEPTMSPSVRRPPPYIFFLQSVKMAARSTRERAEIGGLKR